jgi:hypothetical protein
MRALYIAFIVCSHLLSLALAIYTTRASGVPASILLYAFLIDYALRLGTIQLLHAAVAAGPGTFASALAASVSRVPARGQQSYPVREGEGGPPARLGAYVVVLIVCSFFAFALMNVDSEGELDFSTAAGAANLAWALVIGGIYWANSLLTRTLVIHPDEPVTRNFGYNSKEVTILALAVLTGSVVVAIRQNMDLDASPWTVMGPLLCFRFLYDVSASLARTPAAHAASGELPIRASRSHGPS